MINAYSCTEGCDAIFGDTFTDYQEWLAHEALHIRAERDCYREALVEIVESPHARHGFCGAHLGTIARRVLEVR